jgi:hypothetical protein
MTYALCGPKGPDKRYPKSIPKGHKSGYPTTLVVVMYRVRVGAAPLRLRTAVSERAGAYRLLSAPAGVTKLL